MSIFDSKTYLDDFRRLGESGIEWNKFSEKTIFVSGATGLIGSVFVESLLEFASGCKVIAVGRNEAEAQKRFSKYWKRDCFSFVAHDVNLPFQDMVKADYFVHLASCTHPVAYATKPVETISTNIIGTANMLELARRSAGSRFVFASSNEIFGTNRGDSDLFDEHYCGYIDCNTLRAGYPESKRCGEALCQAYASQYNLDVVIPRFCRCFGPTLRKDDSKALSQFIHNAIKGDNIVLKSKGDQYFSYVYVFDAVSALLTVMLNGNSGEAYNIASEDCDITLRDLSAMIADICGTEVVFELPNATESAGFSKATIARLNPHKLNELGWSAKYGMREALENTIKVLSEQQ